MGFKHLLGIAALAAGAAAAVAVLKKVQTEAQEEEIIEVEAPQSGEMPENIKEDWGVEETVFVPEPETQAPTPQTAQGAAWVNPVESKVDPTRIASPEDFQNWDDLGCQS
ncbi:MAG: hypothetical protein PHG02_07290 [Oscillospiraceae bacterium]|nr:hypothetical protein [Oscillospiraceae bacterium]